MGNHPVTTEAVPPIHTERFGNNNMAPSSMALRMIANKLNQVASRQKRQILCMAQNLNDVKVGSSGAIIAWPTYFRTGENHESLRVLAGGIATDFAASSVPEVLLSIKTATYTSTGISGSIKFNGRGAVATSPDGIVHSGVTISGLSSNTEYMIEMQCTNGARLAYMNITEHVDFAADDATAGVCNPGVFLNEGPIYSSHMQDIIDSANSLWRHNAAQLVGWVTTFEDASVSGTGKPKINGTTYTNIVDGTSTSVSANTPGFKLYTTYGGTSQRTNAIPVKLAVRSIRGSVDKVRFTDGTNSIEIDYAGATKYNGWAVTTGTIPAQTGTKWDLQVKATGAVDAYLDAAFLWQYEA